MNKKFYLIAAAAISMMGAQAATIFVAPQARGAGDGSSWENAAAPTWAYEAGDQVYLSAGRYVETQIELTPGIKIQGGFAMTATGTDLSSYDPVTNETILTSDGWNDDVFLKLEGDDLSLETEIKGVTISGIIGNQDWASATTTFNAKNVLTSITPTGSVLYIKGASLTFKDANISENETNLSAIMVMDSARLKFYDTVIAENVSKIDGTNEEIQPILGAGSILIYEGGADSFLYLERCQIYGNGYESNEVMSKVEDGALIFALKDNDIVLVNNYINGGGLNTFKKSAGIRTMGGVDGTHHALALIAYNTIYNMDVEYRFATGNCVTFGGNTTFFAAGNIIAGNHDYLVWDYGEHDSTWGAYKWNGKTVAEGNVDGTGKTNSSESKTEGTTSNQALTLGNTAATTPAKWLSGGANLVAGRTMIKRGNFWVEADKENPKYEVSTKYEVDDNWRLNSQADVLSNGDELENGHEAYIKPKDAVGAHSANTANILLAWDEYKEYLTTTPYYTRNIEVLPLLEDIDLSVDGRGYKRGATTWSGSYDEAAESGVSELLSENAKVQIKKIADGIYEVKGAESAEAYDLTGAKVATGNGIIDLSGAAKGVYVIKAAGAAAKVLR